jgi:hypothetical protein
MDPDPSAPDVIELSPENLGNGRLSRHKSRLMIAGTALAAFAAIAAVTASAGLWPTAHAAHVNAALARLITQVTTVPVAASDTAGGGLSVMAPTPVTGAPLAEMGKPEVFYVGEEYCPYCAAQNWPLIVALSRFGTFSGLSTVRSADYPPFPPLDTWTFYGSSYTSEYLAFVPVEARSNVLIKAKDNPVNGDSYRELQQLTPAQQAIFAKYDNTRATPFIDFGDKAVMVGSSFEPSVLANLTWSQIAAALGHPDSAVGQAILAATDPITAAVCQLTADRPAKVCRLKVG